jgi:branched-chain amino acid transport system permease protein
VTEILTFVVLGLAAGSLIASLAVSLVLTFRSSGVINFAVGANAAFVAYSYWDLTTRGRLFIGVEIPLTADGSPLAPWLALPISLLIAAALGLLQYFLVYRFLRGASALAKIIASSGVLLVLQSAIVLNFSSDLRIVKALVPATTFVVGGVAIPLDRIIAVAFTVVVALVLTLVYQRTRFGIATRASSDNRKGALLVGIRPGRLEAVNWTIASVLAGLLGIFVTPLIGLQPQSISLFIVPALSAVLLAGFSSFWIAVLAGFGIGTLQALIIYAQGQDWFPRIDGTPMPGFKEALPFLIIALVLFFRGRSLPDRLSETAPRLPRAPRPTWIWGRAGIAVALALVVILAAPSGWRQALGNSLIGAIVCMSFVVVTGYLGQVSLAQMAVAGASGFVLSKAGLELGLPFLPAALLGVVAATLASVIVALPALRMRGMQLAVITLAGAVAIQNLWFRNPEWGGGATAARVDPPSILGLELGSTNSFWNGDDTVPSPGFVLFLLVVATAVGLAIASIRRSRLGARMLAVRANEAATAATGVNVATVKFAAFAIAGAVAGVAGVLYGVNFGLVTANRFDEFAAITFLGVAFLGGITTVSGAVLGGLLVSQGFMMYTVTTLFGIGTDFQILVAGIAVVATVIGNPDGMAGVFRGVFARRAARWRARRAASPGSGPVGIPSTEVVK